MISEEQLCRDIELYNQLRIYLTLLENKDSRDAGMVSIRMCADLLMQHLGFRIKENAANEITDSRTIT
jgi:hypothetical protein